MPVFEFVCQLQGCEQFGLLHEHYVSTSDKPDPPCEKCDSPTQRVISGFAVVFTGPITKKYNDSKAENAHMEGHWAYETKDDAGNKIAPRPIFIDSFQKQKEFAKRQGLVNPKDIGPCEVGRDGKSMSSRGMPGCW